MSTFNKSAWICIQDRKVLFFRNKGKDVFYAPGGKREEGETDEEAVIREIKEEASVDLKPETVQFAAEFSAHAHGKADDVTVVLRAYFAEYEGTLTPTNEIAEMIWYRHGDRPRTYGVGTQLLDWLKEKDLID